VNLGLDLSMKLQQKLSFQMIQSLKLLQVNTLQLEQMLRTELEMNPVLELSEDAELEQETDTEEKDEQIDEKENEEWDQIAKEYLELHQAHQLDDPAHLVEIADRSVQRAQELDRDRARGRNGAARGSRRPSNGAARASRAGDAAERRAGVAAVALRAGTARVARVDRGDPGRLPASLRTERHSLAAPAFPGLLRQLRVGAGDHRRDADVGLEFEPDAVANQSRRDRARAGRDRLDPPGSRPARAPSSCTAPPRVAGRRR